MADARRAGQRPSGGATHETVWRDRTKPFRREWFAAEVKRGQHEESIALFTRMLARFPGDPDFLYARGEAYRLRGSESDFDLALAGFEAAAALSGCVAVAKVETGERVIGERMSVKIDGPWNRINAPGIGPAETWTMEGLPVDQLLLYSGIRDGDLMQAPVGGKQKESGFARRCSRTRSWRCSRACSHGTVPDSSFASSNPPDSAG